ncbi:hypothetical protein ACGIF2_02040 [Cellulomonas sp. P22]
MRGVVVLAEVSTVVLVVWLVVSVVAAVVWRVGPELVAALVVGIAALGVLAARRMRAWSLLIHQVQSDLGLDYSRWIAPITLRHGVAAFDASVVRAREYEALAPGEPTVVDGTGWGAAWERRLARFWGDRYDAAAVHAQRVTAQWVGLRAVAVIAVPTVGMPAVLTGQPWAPAVLLGAIVAGGAGTWGAARARRRTRAAAAHHLGIPERLSGSLPVTPDLVAFDAAVESAHARSGTPPTPGNCLSD